MLQCVIRSPSFALQYAITISTVLIGASGRRHINLSNPCPNVQPSKSNPFTKHSVPGVPWLCCLCPSGTYLENPCREDDFRSTNCTPCLFNPGKSDQQYYIDVEPHNITRCIAAIDSCPTSMIRIQGNSTYPAECRCKEGTYFEASVKRCEPHTPCKRGYGMVLPGNYTNNTYCVWCHEGYESPNLSLTEKCTKIDYSINESSSKSQLDISTTIGNTMSDVTSTSYPHEATEPPDTTAISTGGTSSIQFFHVIIAVVVVLALFGCIIWRCIMKNSCRPKSGSSAAHQEENGNVGQPGKIMGINCAPAPGDIRANGHMGNMQVTAAEPDVPPGENAPLLQNEDNHNGVHLDHGQIRVTYRPHRNDLDGDIAERQVIEDGLGGNESEDATSEDGEARNESEAGSGELGSASGVPSVADRESAAANNANDRVNCQDVAAGEQLIVDLPSSDTNGMSSSGVRGRESTGSQDVSSDEMSRNADNSLSTGRDNVSCDEANTAKEDLRVSIPATATAGDADKAMSYDKQMEKIRMQIESEIGDKDTYHMYRCYRPNDQQFIELLYKLPLESERFNKAFAELIKLGKKTFNPQSLRKVFDDVKLSRFVDIIDDVIGADSE